jgi:hypothetical protein
VSRGAGGDNSDDGIGWEEGVIGNSVNDGIKEGDSEDGEGDGSQAAHNRGERRNLLSSSGPRSSSALLRRFLVLLAGSVVTSGGEGGAGGHGLDGVGDGADASPPARVAKAGTAMAGTALVDRSGQVHRTGKCSAGDSTTSSAVVATMAASTCSGGSSG